MANVCGLVPQGISLFENKANTSLRLRGYRTTFLSRLVENNLVFSEKALMRDQRSIGLRKWFLESGCSSFSDDVADAAKADVIVAQRPSSRDVEEQLFYRSIVNAARSECVFIHPINSINVRNMLNFVFPYDKKAGENKYLSVTECDSQVSRVRFDEMQQNTAISAAMAETPPSGFIFAERFNLALLNPGGIISALEDPNLNRLFEEAGANAGGTAICFSPHADDFPIAAAGLGMHLRSKGWNVFDLVLTLGHMGILDDYAKRHEETSDRDLMATKLRIRTEELERSDKLLGINGWKLLSLGFYDRRKTDGPDIGRRVVFSEDEEQASKAVDSFSRTVNLAFIPHQADMNWDHIATRNISLKILSRVASRQGHPIVLASYPSPWFTGYPPINSLLYYRADNDFAGMYPSAYYAQLALAEAGRELAAGLNPPPLEYFCEAQPNAGRVMAEGFYIATAEALR
ncbi:MAG: PIG-L family deacetylase [Candidatus Saganbacteria bacterium]|nr:PIG-L family deacetylase [Candidatus Saganbacteria bacterium]